MTEGAWSDERRDAPMQPHATAVVLQPGEGRSIDLGNFSMSVKVAGAEGYL